MAKKHIIAAIFALIFTFGIWVGDVIYDKTNTVAIDQCGQGNVKAVSSKGLFRTEVSCFSDPVKRL